MDVLSWAPVVFQKESRPGKVTPEFQIKAWLQCLFCGYVMSVSTTSTHLRYIETDNGQLCELGRTGSYLDTPESRTYSAVMQLGQQRNCENCGIGSVIPPEKAKAFQKEVLLVVTDEWIRDQLTNVRPPEPRFRQDLSSLVETTTKRMFAGLEVDRMVSDLFKGVDLDTIVRAEVAKRLPTLVKEATTRQT